jgi:hypothetical protein
MKTINQKIVTLALTLLAANIFAQPMPPVQGGTASLAAANAGWSPASDLDVMLQAIEMTTPLPATAAPRLGNFYTVQHAGNWPPLPGNIYGLPFWDLGDGFYLLDDRAVNYAVPLRNANLAGQTMMAGGGLAPSGSDGGGFSGSSSYSPDPTGFGIEAQGTNVILHWLSNTNKIFLIEHRATLSSETQRGELQNYFLAAANTNWTKFVHTNILRVQPMDFYRLFDVTPVARNDFFAVDQDSSDNQLDIFQNDYSPNGDLLYISNLIPAHHGGISYTLDASTFQYTPDSGFYGVDSFAYNVTSGYGDISTNATVTVFINQSGNQPPSVPDIIITLQTNVYTATFNALTNATDPDGDTNILFAINPPSLGSISNNANGDITYTRNSNLFGSDAFTYIITDGKGGYGVGKVKILQVDTDGDGMPDQWEMANGLDPTTDNSMADPDN